MELSDAIKRAIHFVKTMDLTRASRRSPVHAPDWAGQLCGPVQRGVKGWAIELWTDGQRYWLVADDKDANRLNEPRGNLYAVSEIQLIARVTDAATVAEIRQWNRRFEAIIQAAPPAVREGDIAAANGRISRS